MSQDTAQDPRSIAEEVIKELEQTQLEAEKAEPAIYVAGEGAEKIVDDACAAHASPPFRCGRRARPAEKAVTGFGPYT